MEPAPKRVEIDHGPESRAEETPSYELPDDILNIIFFMLSPPYLLNRFASLLRFFQIISPPAMSVPFISSCRTLFDV
jgi:hypothetical protein